VRPSSGSGKWRSTLVSAPPNGRLASAATALPGFTADGGAPGVAAVSCPESIS